MIIKIIDPNDEFSGKAVHSIIHNALHKAGIGACSLEDIHEDYVSKQKIAKVMDAVRDFDYILIDIVRAKLLGKKQIKQSKQSKQSRLN